MEFLRHPADSLAWKKFDAMHPIFALDSRNVRLGLAIEGFNPFESINVKYSVWLMLLIPYDLLSWLYMKQSFWIMSMIIPESKSPRNDFDVYL